jgi:hypothetical protein
MAGGAAAVARHARQGAGVDAELHHVLINGAAGVVVTRARLPIAVISFTVAADRIVKINTIADPNGSPSSPPQLSLDTRSWKARLSRVRG